jgi:hypothetical protein
MIKNSRKEWATSRNVPQMPVSELNTISYNLPIAKMVYSMYPRFSMQKSYYNIHIISDGTLHLNNIRHV